MFSKLLVAWSLMAVCVVIHALGVTYALQRGRDVRPASPQVLPWTWLLIRLAAWIILLHLVEITVWALYYKWQRAMPDIQTALYFSAVTYTTTGYGDLVLPSQWRLHGAVEALTGILMCGWSTGFFFAIVSRMFQVTRDAPTFALLIAICLSMSPGVAMAQPGPVAAMFSADQKRNASRAVSFLQLELPATKAAGSPAEVYLSAGDLERAFDTREFRPHAVIVPTNTDLSVTATAPATQRVLIERVQKQADVMRDLEEQIAIRKQSSPPSSGSAGLRIGIDTFVAQLPRGADDKERAGAFPRAACFIATDFANGGAIDRRELFAQDRVRKGIAECLERLDAAGAQSLVLPLMGAASAGTQANDALYEGQRVLMECRLINAAAGIALGVHDFAPHRRNLREIGVVQWDQEIARMFNVPSDSRAAKSAQTAYRAYAEQIKQAFRKGLAGEKTTQSDVSGSCNAIFNVPASSQHH